MLTYPAVVNEELSGLTSALMLSEEKFEAIISCTDYISMILYHSTTWL